jgi:hypothetical protein
MKKILALVWLLLAMQAHAEWQKFQEMDDGTWYVDPSTRTGDKQLRMWILFDQREPVGAFGVRSAKTLIETDCKEGWIREISLVVFNDQMGNGSILRNVSPGTLKIYPQPGSAYEKIAQSLCKR